MPKTHYSLQDKIFKGRDGRIVLWQSPNPALWGWIVLKLLSLTLSHGRILTGANRLSTALLFTWAFLEATNGTNYFRKALGIVVLLAIVRGFFT